MKIFPAIENMNSNCNIQVFSSINFAFLKVILTNILSYKQQKWNIQNMNLQGFNYLQIIYVLGEE